MPTVHEILRQSGFTQEQIDALDPRATTAFGAMMTTAETERATATAAQAKAEADFKAATEAMALAEKNRNEAIAAREQAELQGRSNTEFYETKVVPGLTGWDEEKTKLENERVRAMAEAAFYRTQNEGARTGGFIPSDAPGYKAPEPDGSRGPDGKYVTGGGGTPGSPTFQLDPQKLATQFSEKAAVLSNIDWRYKKLFNDTMPISPTQLIAEADQLKLSPEAYAERRFGFTAREQEINTTRQREHEAKIAADATAAANAAADERMKAREAEFAAKEKQRAEQASNNPDVRMPAGSSKFADVKKAVEAGDRPNPLKMTDAQRRAATTRAIHSEIQERETVGA